MISPLRLLVQVLGLRQGSHSLSAARTRPDTVCCGGREAAAGSPGLLRGDTGSGDPALRAGPALSSEQSTGVGHAWAPHAKWATAVPAQELPRENAHHSAGHHLGGALCRTLLQGRATRGCLVRIGQLSPAHSSSSLTPQCKRVRGIVVIQRQGTRTLREHRPSKSVRFLSVPSFPFLTYY